MADDRIARVSTTAICSSRETTRFWPFSNSCRFADSISPLSQCSFPERMEQTIQPNTRLEGSLPSRVERLQALPVVQVRSVYNSRK